MITIHRKQILLACILALIGVGLLCAGELRAQIATVKGKGKQLGRVELFFDQVPNLTTQDLATVPAGRRLIVTDLIISVVGGGDTTSQRVFRSGTAATAFITVRGSFNHTFATGLEFPPGSIVQVRNGASSGPTSWTVIGYLAKSP